MSMPIESGSRRHISPRYRKEEERSCRSEEEARSFRQLMESSIICEIGMSARTESYRWESSARETTTSQKDCGLVCQSVAKTSDTKSSKTPPYRNTARSRSQTQSKNYKSRSKEHKYDEIE